MDALLNKEFFKCMNCKYLHKITTTERISNDSNVNFSSLLQSGFKQCDNEIRGLFHPNYTLETPVKNMFGCNNDGYGSNLNQNLLNSFNATPMNNILATPKSNSKFPNENLFFSPETGNNQVNFNPSKKLFSEEDKVINLNNLGYSTPRHPPSYTIPDQQVRFNMTTPRRIDNLSMDEFSNKLNIQEMSQKVNQSQTTQYGLLCSKGRIGRVNADNLIVNKNKNNLIEANQSKKLYI